MHRLVLAYVLVSLRLRHAKCDPLTIRQLLFVLTSFRVESGSAWLLRVVTSHLQFRKIYIELWYSLMDYRWVGS